jgi:hypothetical protein
MSLRTCTRCGHEGPLEDFAKDKRAKYGRRNTCKPCMNKNTKAWQDVPGNRKNSILKGTYGITLEEYEERLEAQGGCCAICYRSPQEVEKALGVDHNHETNQIRGLLCDKCNFALGHLNDDPDLLIRAASYLMVHELETVGGKV